MKLFQCAVDDLYDTALVLSGDSDLVPAIRGVKESYPQKQIKVIVPPGIFAENLKQISDGAMKLKEKHLKSSQLEDPVHIDGVNLPCPS
ncbi:MAG: NYN domain-containing protein, partial [Candidatus Doudnabacteria bacterium]|nr:NYN domain-containing protein [Candidatus Doudnabacteria bacterium]